MEAPGLLDELLAHDGRVEVLSLLERIFLKPGREPLCRQSRAAASQRLISYTRKDESGTLAGLGQCSQTGSGGRDCRVFHQGDQGVLELNALNECMKGKEQTAWEGLRAEVKRYILTPVGTRPVWHTSWYRYLMI